MTLPAYDECALVVVDVQNDFCHPEGALARMGQDVSAAAEILPPLRGLLDEADACGVPRIFVRTEHSEWTDTPTWRTRGSGGRTLQPAEMPVCRRGGWGAEFYGVHPAGSDWVVVKHRYSAFAYTPLELALEARGRAAVLLAGTTTNVCVEATALDALARGFRPVLLSDVTSCSSEEKQRAAVAEFTDHIGRATTTEELLAAWADREPASA